MSHAAAIADQFARILGPGRGGGVERTDEQLGVRIAQTVWAGDLTDQEFRLLPARYRRAVEDLKARVAAGEVHPASSLWDQTVAQLAGDDDEFEPGT